MATRKRSRRSIPAPTPNAKPKDLFERLFEAALDIDLYAMVEEIEGPDPETIFIIGETQMDALSKVVAQAKAYREKMRAAGDGAAWAGR